MTAIAGSNNSYAYPHSLAFEVHSRRTIVSDESHEIGHLLSRELLKLSMDDRTAIQEEIHGVGCMAVHETPEVIRKGLDEFHIELEKIPKEQNRTYSECRVRAMLYQDEQDSCYALKDSFKLRFLRAELFDAAKAVRRFAHYLEFVREFWGPEIALKRLIRLSDFTKDEMKLFRKGFFQVLPFRDHSGRRVMTLLGGFDPGVNRISRSKALFYLADVLSRNSIESQQRGLVVVTEACLFSGTNSGSDKQPRSFLSFPNPNEGLNLVKRMFESTPNRVIAVHNCWPDRPAFRLLEKLLTIYGMSGSSQRLRLKFHIGDELEMRYRLKSYGIPIELLPITETGSIKIINHNYWIKTRKHIEQGVDLIVMIVECPCTNDVVFRQGTSSMENPGNVKCRDLILSLLEDRDGGMPISSSNYYNTKNNTNTTNMAAKYHNDIVDRLVEQIEHYRCGHFLEWDKHRNAWIRMIDRHKVKQKVSVLLHSIDKRYRRAAASNNGGRSITSSRAILSSNSTMLSRNSNSNIGQNSVNVQHTGQRTPSLMIQQTLDAMAIKSDEEDEGEQLNFGASQGGLGAYSFTEGGMSVLKQQKCCRMGKDVFPSPQTSRKRPKQTS